MRSVISIIVLVFLVSIDAYGVDRNQPLNVVFTTTVLKINRTTGQMIMEYSDGGKGMVKKDGLLLIENYDALEKKLLIEVMKLHEKKPWIIVMVKKGEYKEIERGFRYRTSRYQGEQKTKPSKTPPPTPNLAPSADPSPKPQ